VTIRAACHADLPAIAQIQSLAPDASQWNPNDYLAFDCRVAVAEGAVIGFIVTRSVAGGESEILNLAVTPQVRRKGVGRHLLSDTLSRCSGDFFLEVRESNAAARRFYEHLGFEVVTRRLQYYSNPEESALVMKFHS
jgi:ribosomal-protein-alanine N-acetyltransferase